jgi:hypothetical protein
MSGGGNNAKHLMPKNISFPMACINHPKNLKASNAKANRISAVSPIVSQHLEKIKETDLTKLKEKKELGMVNKIINGFKNNKILNEKEENNMKEISGNFNQEIIIGKEIDPIWNNKREDLAKKIQPYFEVNCINF